MAQNETFKLKFSRRDYISAGVTFAFLFAMNLLISDSSWQCGSVGIYGIGFSLIFSVAAATALIKYALASSKMDLFRRLTYLMIVSALAHSACLSLLTRMDSRPEVVTKAPNPPTRPQRTAQQNIPKASKRIIKQASTTRR